MSSFEQAFQQLPENLPDFFARDGDDIAFVDPLYGDRLGAWPRVLEHDVISREGREYLENSGHSLDIVHCLHGNPEDFAHILREHGDTLRAAAVIAIETDWDPECTDFSNPANVRMPQDARREFFQTEVEWAQRHGKVAMPYDIDGPADPLRRAMAKLWDRGVSHKDIAFPEEVPVGKREQITQMLTNGAYATLRLPMLLGQIGFGLNNLAENGHIEPDDRVAVLLGVGNYPNFANVVRQSGIIPSERVSTAVAQGSVDRLTNEEWAGVTTRSQRRAAAGMRIVEMLEL